MKIISKHKTLLPGKRLAVGLIVVLLCNFTLSAQQFNNWYFPQFLGITFNTNPPTSLIGGQISQNRSCASISDKFGQLLFYTDGVRVWNKNHQMMPNGNGLFGASAQVNSALIIPLLNDTLKYCVFTADGITFPSVGSLGYNYSIVDMNLNNGLGDVTIKNSFLYGPSAEKICAVPHSNGTDIWVITKDQTNKFYSFRLTCSGINSTPIVSILPIDIPSNLLFFIGDIKASSNGKYICMTQQQRNYFEIYKFDNTTGILSAPIKFVLKSAYGVEFSPDNNKLYIGCNKDTVGTITSNTAEVYQYNLAIYDSLAIANSKFKVGEKYGGSLYGGLQLGPDNKIYHVGFNNFALDIIEYPNLIGNACSFQLNRIPLSNSFTNGRLPYAAPFLFTNQNVQIPAYTIAADCRTVTLTGKTYIRGSNLTFEWRFGDGDSTVQIVPSGGDTTYTTVTHTYPPGTDSFNVQLFVTSDTVCGQGSAGKRITFTSLRPTARFGYTAACGQLSVPFSDSSLPNGIAALRYRWRFVDQQGNLLGTDTVQNPTFTYPQYDTVRAMLIVSGSTACTRPDTLVRTLVLLAKPVTAFTYTNTCGSLSATFTGTATIATGSLQSSQWLFGDGSTSTAANPAHAYGSFGPYAVKFTATSTAGCTSDTAVQTIAIRAKPVAGFTYPANTGCAGTALPLQDSSTAAGSTIQSYWWGIAALNQTSTQAAIQPVFATGGSYTVQHSVTTAQGCPSDTLSKTILIQSIPVAAITSVAVACTGEAVTFASNSTSNGQIDSSRWQVGSGPWVSAGGNAAFTYSFATAGSYIIRHQAVSTHGCTSNIATQTIAIEGKPLAGFTNSLLCPGKAVLFTNTSTIATSTISGSQWRINSGAAITVSGTKDYTYTFSQPGTYAVQLSVSTASGCSSTITKNLVIAGATASAGQDTTVRAGEPFTLQGSGGISYRWQPPTGLSDATKDQPTGLLSSNQRYTVQVTTAEGCLGYDTMLVTVLRQLKIANAFSPNGDGINDEWRIEQLRDYPNAQLQLYDRYGQLVYTAKGGNTTAGWKGTAAGNKPVAMGAYYYVINLNSPLHKQPYTGWVMVVR